MARNRQNKTIDDLIQKFVIEDVHTGCWNWTGALHVQGYAMCRYDGKMHTAQRLFKMHTDDRFDLTRADRVSNTCGNINCVNPAHHTIQMRGTYETPCGQRPSKFSQEEYEELMKEYNSTEHYFGKDAKFAKKHGLSAFMLYSMKKGTYRPTR